MELLKFFRVIILLVLCGFFLLSELSFGQTLPTGASPDKTIKKPGTPSQELSVQQPDHYILLPDMPELPVPQTIEGVLQLNEVIFKGVTVYADDILLSFYSELLGKVIPLTELYGIANKLTAQYHSDGYALSQAFVPGQEIVNGIVEIWVVEGALVSYRIEGNPGGSQKVISWYAEQLIESRPLKSKELERYLLLMNDLPGTVVDGYIVPGNQGLANAELVLRVNTKQTGGYIGVDNRGSEFFGPDQTYVNIQGYGLLGSGELIEFSPMVNGMNNGPESWGGFLNVRVPVSSKGGYVQAYAAASKTKPGGFLEDLDLRGEAFFGTLAYGFPVIRQIDRYLYLTGQFDVIETKEDIYKETPFIEDSLRVFRGNMVFGKADALGGENFLDLKLSAGINGLGATSSNDTLRSRDNADASFISFGLNAARRQSLDSLAKNLRLFLGLEAQYSSEPLLAAEEFGLGGPVFLQGYDYYEVSGDYGFAAKVEFQYDLKAQFFGLNEAAEFFAFYDIGKVWNHDALDYEFNNISLASTGAGVRLGFNRHLLGSLYVAQPLTKDVVATEDKDMRYFFQLAYTW